LSASILLIFTLAGCGGKTFYYRPGGNQTSFDRDAEICLQRAKDITRSQMVNPEGDLDTALLQRHYEDCLYAKGWSEIPLNQRERSLWTWKGNRIYFGKFSMELPAGFQLLRHSRWVYGPGWVHQLFVRGPDRETYLVLIAQENPSKKFAVIDYPTPQGYSRYTSGMLDRYKVRWSVFTGYHDNNPIVLLGAYAYMDKRRRISIVFSRYLEARDPPLPGFTLSSRQKEEVEALYTGWLSWLKQQIGAKEGEKKSFIRRYFHILPTP